jgi:hypothetical protein
MRLRGAVKDSIKESILYRLVRKWSAKGIKGEVRLSLQESAGIFINVIFFTFFERDEKSISFFANHVKEYFGTGIRLPRQGSFP